MRNVLLAVEGLAVFAGVADIPKFVAEMGDHIKKYGGRDGRSPPARPTTR